MSDLPNTQVKKTASNPITSNTISTNTISTNTLESNKLKENTIQTGSSQLPAPEVMQPAMKNGSQSELDINETLKKVKSNMPKVYTRASYSSESAKNILTSKRSFGMSDSGEMDAVKRTITEIENTIELEKGEVSYTADSLSDVIQKYNDAITACNTYLTDPRKNKRSRRYALVQENYDKLKGEVMKLEKAKDLIAHGKLSGEKTTLSTLMSEAERLAPGEQISRSQIRREEDAEFAESQK